MKIDKNSSDDELSIFIIILINIAIFFTCIIFSIIISSIGYILSSFLLLKWLDGYWFVFRLSIVTGIIYYFVLIYKNKFFNI